MERFGSVISFREWQSQLKVALDPDRKEVTICGGTGCVAFGSPDVQKAFQKELEVSGLTEKASVKRTGCHGFCEKGPLVIIRPEKVFYPSVKVKDVPEIIEKTVLKGEAVDRLAYVDPGSDQKIFLDDEVPFYAKQQRSVFRLNGVLDPLDLE
ncbi:MAG: (2Fe-2S) ferredoxin domain-containing protein, partial [Planctomycetota bacterium]|nr:(2Fe-2S) ferredoxin domain-containing protein [Planctomycetota bacterium]